MAVSKNESTRTLLLVKHELKESVEIWTPDTVPPTDVTGPDGQIPWASHHRW